MTTITVAQAQNLDSTLELLKSWGFKVLTSTKANLGNSNKLYETANIELPAGWKPYTGLSQATASSFLDTNGDLRVCVCHSTGEVLPENYGVRFFSRFSVQEQFSESRKLSGYSLIDSKTKQEFKINVEGVSSLSSIEGTRSVQQALTKKFNLAGNNADETGLALARLWDSTVVLTEDDAKNICVEALKVLYTDQIANLQTKLAKLTP